MSYRTDFTLDFDVPSSEKSDTIFSDINTKLNEITGYYWDGFELNDATWYEWERDMRKVSEQFPNILFTLWGNGESSDDKWVAYIKNGKIQYKQAEIVYPDFDESKLV